MSQPPPPPQWGQPPPGPPGQPGAWPPPPQTNAAPAWAGAPSGWGPPPTPHKRRSGALRIIIGVLVGAVVLGGLVVGGLSLLAADRDDDGKVVAEGNSDLDDLQIGDCMMLPDEFGESEEGVEVSSARVKPCDQPHEAEVYAFVEFDEGPDAPFPGDDALVERGTLLCVAPFEAYVGATYEDSVFDYSVLTPVAEGWALGDRQGTCFLGDPSDPEATGSAKGSGR